MNLSVVKQAVVLSAGMGSRMKELTAVLPKPMLPVDGRPLLEKQILWLKEWGVEEFFINLFYLPQKVQQYFGDGSKWGIKIHYSLEKELMGTGGAYLAFASQLDTNFVSVNCDVIIRTDLAKAVDFHLRGKSWGTMILSPFADEHNYSSVYYENGKVKSIGSNGHKYGRKGIFTGLQILSDKIFDYLPEGPSSVISAFYLPAVEKGKISAFTEVDEWIDLGTKELYEAYIYGKI